MINFLRVIPVNDGRNLTSFLQLFPQEPGQTKLLGTFLLPYRS
jgi:hypothetical protein